jgi:hypothetical protein
MMFLRSLIRIDLLNVGRVKTRVCEVKITGVPMSDDSSSRDVEKSARDILCKLTAREAHTLRNFVTKRPLVITEGKTDWRHIKYALYFFKSHGEFTDISIDFFEFDSDVEMGDARLSQMCVNAAALPSERKKIFVFDRDNPKMAKEMSSESGSFKDWGNQVYSLCLPVPSFREKYKNLSIELYYTDSDLRVRDPHSNKRLWFTNEIEVIVQPTRGLKTFRALEKPLESDEHEKKVFDIAADQIVDANGKSVGLSKSAFVEAIVGNIEISNNFNREAFRQLFNVIRNIIHPGSTTNNHPSQPNSSNYPF